jgi:hypothetical protein
MAATKFMVAITSDDGSIRREECAASTFEEVIGATRFKFAVHKSRKFRGSLTLSHFASGKRVCEITPTELCAAPGAKPIEHGRYALAKLIAAKGVARVASVLTHADTEAGAL